MTNPATSIHVLGAGLIGTSLGLAYRACGFEVTIEDRDPVRNELATDLLNSRGSLRSEPELIIVAVPPRATPQMIADALRQTQSAIVIDVSSIKSNVVNEVKALTDKLDRYVPSHPIAGREVGGPSNAQGDLFQGRPWIVTPHGMESPLSIEKVKGWIELVGSHVKTMTPEEHDRLFARISHLPQLISTALSAQILAFEGDVTLAGQGLRDMTRLGGSDGVLWSEIAIMNSTEISESLIELRKILTRIEMAIDTHDVSTLLSIFSEGNEGRKLFAGKHGGKPRDYVLFRIVIEDKPGVLAELFQLCGENSVNVEDLQIEHTPNQETGLITLAVLPEQSEMLESVLAEGDWKFYLERRQQ